jgi:beta-lactam-binding protein with PASTA domain
MPRPARMRRIEFSVEGNRYNLNSMKSFFRLVLLSLVLLIVALVSALTAMRFAIHSGEVAVPDLVGKSPAEARRIAEDKGQEVNVERQFYSSTVPEGKIVSQMPLAGTKVRRGWEISVAESLGPQRVAIPNVLGESDRAAEINIQRRGLNVSAVAQISLANLPADQVIAQSPPPNANGVSAPKISLLLAQTPQPAAFVMPNFAGQSSISVSAVLQGAGLRMGTITVTADNTSSASASSPASRIITQDPVAGQKVSAGTAVNFVVR